MPVRIDSQSHLVEETPGEGGASGKMPGCPFCATMPEAVLFNNEHWFAIHDRFPVGKGHLLVIPYRHVADYFETTADEKIALLALIDRSRDYLEKKYHPDGYNIGVNIGRVAGQSVMHVHFHIIPRYAGDSKRPAGGVRNVIPKEERKGH